MHRPDWLPIYFEHARHEVYKRPWDEQVLSHVWRVAWLHQWTSLVEYLQQHVPIQLLRNSDQWGLNMCLLEHIFGIDIKDCRVGALGVDNLSGADLSWASLRKVLLEAFDLSRCVLHGANLAQAGLLEVDFIGAKLTNVNLSGADLAHCDFSGAQMMEASLKGSEIFRGSFNGADLSRACLNGIEADGPNFDKANLSEASLNKSSMIDVYLREAVMVSADCREAWFGADLSGADLSRADLRLAVVMGSLSGANLNEADLRWSRIGGVDMSGACLDGVRLEGALYEKTAIWPKDFKPEMHGATLVEHSVELSDEEIRELRDAYLADLSFLHP